MSMLVLCTDKNFSPDLTYSSGSSCREMIWLTGEPIPQDYDLSRLEFLCENLPFGRLADFAVSDVGCPVVSESFVRMLLENGVDNLQIFPASIKLTEDGASVDGYFAINILGIFDVIDLKNSLMDYENEDGNLAIYFIDKLVLQPDSDEHALLYRPRGFRSRLLINYKFKKIAEQMGFIGALMVSPEVWNGF